MLDAAQASRQGSIEEMVAECQENIWRQERASLRVLGAGLVAVVLLALVLLSLAQMQGAREDEKWRALNAGMRDRLLILQQEQALTKQSEGSFAALEERRKGKAPVSVMEVEHAKSTLEKQRIHETTAQDEYNTVAGLLRDYKAKPVVTEPMLIAWSALFIIVIGLCASLYRFHLREIIKLEHYRLGLQRLRLAATNWSTPGFDAEVRTALTRGAFDAPGGESLLGRRDKAQAPVPGRSAGDVETSLLNRFLDEVEIHFKPRAKGTKQHVDVSPPTVAPARQQRTDDPHGDAAAMLPQIGEEPQRSQSPG